jgi:hypothetical protein
MNPCASPGRLQRTLIGAAAAAAIAAAGVVPAVPSRAAGYASVEPAAGAAAAAPQSTAGASQLLPGAVAPWARNAAPKRAKAPDRKAAVAQSGSATPPPAAAAAASPASGGEAMPAAGGEAMAGGLDVVRWGIGPQLHAAGAAAAGRPLYLWMTIAGGAAAADQLRDGPIAIEAHWSHAAASGGGRGAPDLTTRLSVGRPGLASALAGEVRHQGHFAWHTWTRKDALTPGQWTVSLTYPNGSPLPCGAAFPQPCHLSFTVD